jgi:hypothetical protein
MGGRRPAKAAGFAHFDVEYEDGSRSSNRRVPAGELGGLDGDLPARSFIESQDRAIAELSGRPRPAIKTITRAQKRSETS